MHIYPYMDFETLKRHLLKGNVIITFESMTSDKVFTKTCTLKDIKICLLYTSPSPRDQRGSRLAGCG